MNKENLRKLANYLLSGNLKSRFGMAMYCCTPGSDPCTATDCGTVGCAVGHGPHAGIEKYPTETWIQYTRRAFIPKRCNAKQRWCFSGGWVDVDNTPEGAGLRIMWLLEHGLPDNWHDQIRGKAPLCYR